MFPTQWVFSLSLHLLLYHFFRNRNCKEIVSPPSMPKVLGIYIYIYLYRNMLWHEFIRAMKLSIANKISSIVYNLQSNLISFYLLHNK